jgi:hypothetical protein
MTLPFIPMQAPAEVSAERLATCRACEFHGTGYAIGLEICKACGCPLLSKTKFQQSTCPQGKW